MKYSTVLFDADMTLLNFNADETAALYRVLSENGIQCDETVHALYHEINIGFWKKYENGEIDKSEIGPGRFNALVKKLNYAVSGDKLNREYMKNLCNGGEVLEGADMLCSVLQKRGFRLYIITNGTDYIQEERLKRSGLIPYFNGVFISDKVGYQKPKKEFFDYVLSHIDEKDKSKILIVGDSLTSDIRGGINSGMDTCLYAPHDIPENDSIIPTYTVRSYAELITLLEN